MLTIGQAARITGGPTHTLRAWERRYGAFQPTRTPGGYRTYDDDSLMRIRAMRDLVAGGMSASDAAGVVSALGPATPAVAADVTQKLIEAAGRLDASAASRIVTAQFESRSFESMADDWLLPAMVRIGSAWADGEISEAGEHLVANIVMRRLATAFDAVGANPPLPPVIVGAPSGVDHELGLLAFAVALRRAGVATLYLGADVPAGAWSEAVAASGAVLSVTAVPRRADLRRMTALAEQLRADHPQVPLAVGGRFQELAPSWCRRLGHKVGPAASELAQSLGEP